MSNGTLLPAQLRVLASHVIGREVHDLGSGDCELSVKLIDIGARYVWAVDKERFPSALPPRISQQTMLFSEYAKTHPFIDVAFVSWPVVHATPGLVHLVMTARTVVYLGHNFDGTACGSVDLFLSLRKREVLAHRPSRQNTLIIYGKHLSERRVLLPEEYAGIHRDGVYEYGQLDGGKSAMAEADSE